MLACKYFFTRLHRSQNFHLLRSNWIVLQLCLQITLCTFAKRRDQPFDRAIRLNDEVQNTQSLWCLEMSHLQVPAFQDNGKKIDWSASRVKQQGIRSSSSRVHAVLSETRPSGYPESQGTGNSLLTHFVWNGHTLHRNVEYARTNVCEGIQRQGIRKEGPPEKKMACQRGRLYMKNNTKGS